MTHIPGHIGPMAPAYQPFNPFGAYTNTFGSSPYGHTTGSLWGDIQQAPGVDFVPGLSTAANWNEMGNWERGLSLGLDALDLATMGTAKFGTTPLRLGTGLLKGGSKLMSMNDPALAYLRLGEMPSTGYRGSPTVSTNYFTGEPEVGISTYQGLRFPGQNLWSKPEYVMRPMPNTPVVHPLPEEHYRYGSMYSKGGELLSEPQTTYNVIPRKGQVGMFHERPMFELTGTPMSTLGSDTEAVLDHLTAAYRGMGQAIPQQNVKLYNPEFADVVKRIPEISGESDLLRYQTNPNVLNPRTGKSINLETEFAKYDQFGNRIDPLWRDRLPSSLPWMENLPSYLGTTPLTTPARSVLNYNQSNNVRPLVRNWGNGDTGG